MYTTSAHVYICVWLYVSRAPWTAALLLTGQAAPIVKQKVAALLHPEEVVKI